MTHRISVRSASASDVDYIYALLAPQAEQGVILGRDRDNIFQHLQEFLLAECNGAPAGAVAIHVYAGDLAEIRSLVVDPAFQGHGTGRILVEACEQWAKRLGVSQLFALTYVADFFIRQGYEHVSKETLPHKVWTVCVHCARFADCDELAVRKRL
jgi:amino-acid N-acetyltransferase